MQPNKNKQLKPTPKHKHKQKANTNNNHKFLEHSRKSTLRIARTGDGTTGGIDAARGECHSRGDVPLYNCPASGHLISRAPRRRPNLDNFARLCRRKVIAPRFLRGV
jgi:hypothetical protein